MYEDESTLDDLWAQAEKLTLEKYDRELLEQDPALYEQAKKEMTAMYLREKARRARKVSAQLTYGPKAAEIIGFPKDLVTGQVDIEEGVDKLEPRLESRIEHTQLAHHIA